MAGLASASITRRRAPKAWLTITALGGSPCNSSGSTRNSLERWTVWPSAEFSPIARDVVIPHDVLALIPSVSESESLVPCDCEVSALPDPVRAANGAAPALEWPRPRLRPVVWLRDSDTDTDCAVPTVEV